MVTPFRPGSGLTALQHLSVANPVAATLDGLDDVRTIVARNLARHDIINFQHRRVGRYDGIRPTTTCSNT